jgi:adenylate cyclase
LVTFSDVDEARRIWQELKEINPKYSFNEHFSRQPFKNEEDVRRVAEGLAKAGFNTLNESQKLNAPNS